MTTIKYNTTNEATKGITATTLSIVYKSIEQFTSAFRMGRNGTTYIGYDKEHLYKVNTKHNLIESIDIYDYDEEENFNKIVEEIAEHHSDILN